MEYWTPASALVVVAHPDDIEFGSAGTVARWVSEGARVTYALLTNGAAGSSDPQLTRERLAELREAEQRAAAKVLGVDQVEFLGFEDGLLEPSLEVRKQVVRLIRKVRPEVVVTTDPTTWASSSGWSRSMVTLKQAAEPFGQVTWFAVVMVTPSAPWRRPYCAATARASWS
jgi:hypothetical protein